MDKEKIDDAQYFVTCTHCGTQTGLSFRQLEDNRPVKCPACGAPLEIVPPPKAPRKGKKPKRDYGRLIDDPIWGAYWRDRRNEDGGGEWDPEMGAILFIVWAGIALIIVIILLLTGKC